jgi:4a-hydroxytetrahydrobiopterin dehydratase
LLDALTRLTGWSGDDQMIRCEYAVDDVGREQLTADIVELAATTHHSILVTDTPAGVGVTLATDDVDGVSEVDIAVASRLNDLVSGAAARHVPQQRPSSLNQA